MKLSQLFETQGTVYLPKAGDYAVSIVANNRSNPPSYFIFSDDKTAISGSNNITLIKINTSKFKEMYYYNRDKDIDQQILTFIRSNIFNFLLRPNMFDADTWSFKLFKTELEKYKQLLEEKGVLKVFKFNNVSSLSRTLALKYNIAPNIIASITGTQFDEHTESEIKIGQSELIFPETMRGSRIEEIKKLITVANDVVMNHGLGILTNVKMLVAPIPGNTIGLYYMDTKQIKIDPSAKATKAALRTIIHEYGHKWFYEHMTKEQQSDVQKKYYEVYSTRTGTRKASGEQMVHSARVGNAKRELVNNLKVGDELDYIGRKKNLQGLSPFRIISLTPERMTLQSTGQQYGGKLSGSPEAFINYGLVHNGQKLEVKIPPPVTPEIGKQSGWFPTEYSEKDYTEWYAELFAFCLLGLLHDQEVIEFLKSTLK